MIRVLPLSLVVTLAAVLVPCSVADEPVSSAWWPQFRGPNGSGIAAEGDYPIEFDKNKNMLWQVALPSGVSSPCIWNDKIFLTASLKGQKKLRTICIARDSGKILWRVDAPAEEIEKVHSASSPASATPVTDGERVYVYFGSYGLECYDFDGNRLWTKPLGMAQNRWGMGTSPILAGSLLILACDQGGNVPFGVNRVQGAKSYLLACDSRTGKTAWRVQRPESGSGWSTPIVWKQPAGDQLVVYSDRRAVAYDVNTGKEFWSVDQLPSDAVGTPVIGDGLLFLFGSSMGGDEDSPIMPPFNQFLERADQDKDGKISLDEGAATPLDARSRVTKTRLNYLRMVQSADANEDGFATQDEWRAMRSKRPSRPSRSSGRKDRLVAIQSDAETDATQAQIAWQAYKGIPDNPSALYYEGHVYLVKSGGIVSCFEAATGKEAYRKRVNLRGNISASPVVAGGNIYVVSENGQFVVFRAGPSGDVLAKGDLQERIMATPAMVDGKAYVRSNGHIFAFGE